MPEESNFRLLLQLVKELLVLAFSPWRWFSDPQAYTPSPEEQARFKKIYEERLAQNTRWLDRAMVLHKLGKVEEIDAEIVAENPQQPDFERAPQLADFHEMLARRLAASGDPARAKLYAEMVVRFFEEELGRECGGAGGHAANIQLQETVKRLHDLLSYTS